MSGGRLDVGLGAGWYDAEHEAFGIPLPDIRTRYDVLEDQLAIHGLTGSPAEVLETIAVYAAAGAERFYLQVLDLDDLDHLRLVAEEALPHAAIS